MDLKITMKLISTDTPSIYRQVRLDLTSIKLLESHMQLDCNCNLLLLSSHPPPGVCVRLGPRSRHRAITVFSASGRCLIKGQEQRMDDGGLSPLRMLGTMLSWLQYMKVGRCRGRAEDTAAWTGTLRCKCGGERSSCVWNYLIMQMWNKSTVQSAEFE